VDVGEERGGLVSPRRRAATTARGSEVHVPELDRGCVADRAGVGGADRRGDLGVARGLGGRSSTSWMRPRAPSAWLTEVIAPKNEPSGCTRKKRNITNVTSCAIVIAPEATRNPPTPRTTSSDSCRAMPAIGTMNADAFATCTPAS
jgi:hypothetical protein